MKEYKKDEWSWCKECTFLKTRKDKHKLETSEKCIDCYFEKVYIKPSKFEKETLEAWKRTRELCS